MSAAPMAIPLILAPLQFLWRWFTPAGPNPVRGRSPPSSRDGQHGEFAPHAAADPVHQPAGKRPRPHPAHALVQRPLRIVRVMEAGQTPAQVGRMVISGRMADVCAELDRLAARAAIPHGVAGHR